jgi:hypothetical protein
VGVLHHEALIHQSLKSAFPIFWSKTVEIFLSHLVYDYADYSLGTSGLGPNLKGTEHQEK